MSTVSRFQNILFSSLVFRLLCMYVCMYVCINIYVCMYIISSQGNGRSLKGLYIGRLNISFRKEKIILSFLLPGSQGQGGILLMDNRLSESDWKRERIASRNQRLEERSRSKRCPTVWRAGKGQRAGAEAEPATPIHLAQHSASPSVFMRWY